MYPDSSIGKESACNAGDPSSIPGLGRSPGEGKGYPLQYFGWKNSMDCIVSGVTESWTQLVTFTFTSLSCLSVDLCGFILFGTLCAPVPGYLFLALGLGGFQP